jgi:hypothetical protein
VAEWSAVFVIDLALQLIQESMVLFPEPVYRSRDAQSEVA